MGEAGDNTFPSEIGQGTPGNGSYSGVPRLGRWLGLRVQRKRSDKIEGCMLWLRPNETWREWVEVNGNYRRGREEEGIGERTYRIYIYHFILLDELPQLLHHESR